MEEFLVSPYFRFGIFPVGSAILGIAIKYVTRNDQYSSFAKEDLAIGLELMRTACLMFVVLTTDKALELIKTNKEMARVLAATPIDPFTAANLQSEAQRLSSQL